MRHLVAGSLLASLLLGLAACGSAPEPPPKFPDIRFTGEPPLRLTALNIEVVSSFQPSFKPPEVEYQFAIPPQRAIENWAHDHVIASGGGDLRVRVTIEDASVRAVPLYKKAGIEASLTTQPIARYDARVAAKIEILDDHGFALKTARAEARRSETADDDMSLNDRDQLWYEMTLHVVRDLGRELDHQIRANFSPYVI